MTDRLLETTRRAWFAQGISVAASLAIDVTLARHCNAQFTDVTKQARAGGRAWGLIFARLQSLQDGGADVESLRGLMVALGCRFRRPIFLITQPRPKPLTAPRATPRPKRPAMATGDV